MKKLKFAFMAVLAGAFAPAAFAQLPAWTADIGTEGASAVADAAALVGPVIGAALVAIIIIKLVKRFANRI